MFQWNLQTFVAVVVFTDQCSRSSLWPLIQIFIMVVYLGQFRGSRSQVKVQDHGSETVNQFRWRGEKADLNWKLQISNTSTKWSVRPRARAFLLHKFVFVTYRPMKHSPMSVVFAVLRQVACLDWATTRNRSSSAISCGRYRDIAVHWTITTHLDCRS